MRAELHRVRETQLIAIAFLALELSNSPPRS
jgi:hypothetical protein